MSLYLSDKFVTLRLFSIRENMATFIDLFDLPIEDNILNLLLFWDNRQRTKNVLGVSTKSHFEGTKRIHHRVMDRGEKDKSKLL